MYVASQPSFSGRTQCEVRTFDVTRRLAYCMSFYNVALPALLRPHRLLEPNFRTYTAPFSLRPGQKERWSALFGCSPSERIGFTYANTAATMILMRILADLGINFRHVRHLQCELVPPTAGFEQGQLYEIVTEVRPPVRLKTDRVGIVTDTAITKVGGGRVARQTDCWCILNLPEADVSRRATRLDPQSKTLMQARKLKPRLRSGQARQIEVPHDLGRRYGWLSGDLNPTHLSHWAARLFGSPTAFVQGFCTVNLLLAALHRPGTPVASLSTHFVKPLFVGQQATLVVEGSEYELVDSRGALVACGSLAIGSNPCAR